MSIIGISGRIGSGKDTVGKIIQSICAKDFGVYKTQLDFINGGDWVREKQSGWEIKKFAGKLKEIASLLTGVPVERFEDQDFKQSYLGEQWAKTPVTPLNECTIFDPIDLNNLMTYRDFLQKLGTEAMRDNLHENVWVNSLFADYKWYVKNWDELGTEIDGAYPNWIITDMRFPNEMDAVKDKGGVTIRVVRPGTATGTHPSETSLDSSEFDYEINNNGSIEDLIEKVREILTKEKII